MSAAGAAMLAASGLSRDLRIEPENVTRFIPAAAAQQRDAMLRDWREAISRALWSASTGHSDN